MHRNGTVRGDYLAVHRCTASGAGGSPVGHCNMKIYYHNRLGRQSEGFSNHIESSMLALLGPVGQS